MRVINPRRGLLLIDARLLDLAPAAVGEMISAVGGTDEPALFVPSESLKDYRRLRVLARATVGEGVPLIAGDPDRPYRTLGRVWRRAGRYLRRSTLITGDAEIAEWAARRGMHVHLLGARSRADGVSEHRDVRTVIASLRGSGAG